jgi:hypothetical protein
MAETKLLEEARKALGLKPEEIFDSKDREGELTIVTVGGHKVQYRSGMTVTPLHALHAGRSIKPPEPPKA